MLRQHHDNAALANDAGLLRRNLTDGISQELLMIERNVGYHRDARVNDVRSVQPTAHSDLEHRDFHACAGEIFESHRGEHLEETRRMRQLSLAYKLCRDPLDPLMDLSEFRIADLLAADADALIDPLQMWRGVQPGAVSRSLQYRSESCCG